jgi:hypothetical protein
MPLKVLLCSGNDASPQHRIILRAIHAFNSLKNYTRLLGGCCPSIQPVGAEQKASCGALGSHIRRRWPWLATVVLADVGSWRLMSGFPTIGIVAIVYGSIFLFLRRSHIFLTSDPAAK